MPEGTAPSASPAPKRRRTEPDTGKVQVAVQKFGKETRAVNEVDVVLTTITAAIAEYRESLAETNESVPELDTYEREVEYEFTAQDELIDEHKLLQSALRRSGLQQRKLREQLLHVRLERSVRKSV